MHNGLLEILLLAQHKADPKLASHCRRVACYAAELAKELKLDADFKKKLLLGGLLHDIGFIGLDLDFGEFSIRKHNVQLEATFQEHSAMGEHLISKIIHDPTVLSAIRGHHEQFDGTGYPDQVKAEQIPLAARVLAVADYYDTLLVGEFLGEHRQAPKTVLEHLQHEARGKALDPKLVDAFVKILDRIPVLYLAAQDNELQLYQLHYLQLGPLESGDLVNQHDQVLVRQGMVLDQKMLDNIRWEYPGQKIIRAV